MTKSLNIFASSDYRLFIKDWLTQAKEAKTANLSTLAADCHVHPTYLSQVLAGRKDLSLEQAAFLSQRFQFTTLEEEYFFVLIQLNRAGTQLLKDVLNKKKKMIEAERNKLSRRFENHRELSTEEKATFYSSWIYAAVWATTAIAGGQTLNQIAERFQVTRERAEEVLSFLHQTGLCDETKGVYSPGKIHVHVPNESPFVLKHHANWRIRALSQADGRNPSELFFTAPMVVEKKDFEVIREKLNFAIKDIIESAKASGSEELVCLNIDFFRPIR
jgi:uncharacterized protein (TIGR02147 family)